MEIVSELAAVERRIAEISAWPIEDAPRFGAALETGAPRARIARGDRRLVDVSAAATRVDPALVEAVIANESGFDPAATSVSGARGLMQLMPETAAGLGVGDPYDPAQNVRGGTRYLRSLLDRFGSVELAVAAYNAGPAAVEELRRHPALRRDAKVRAQVLTRYRVLESATSR